MDQPLPFFLVLVFSLAISFLCSGMEAGVFALSRLRIRQQMKRGKKRAAVLYRFLENVENFLWTILIGNTLANFTAIGLIAIGLALVVESRGLLLGLFMVSVFLFYALCDLLPKMLFRTFPNRLCMAVARPFRGLHLVLSPVVALVAWFSNGLLWLTGGRIFTGHLFGNRTEFRLVMREADQGLTSEERTMINRVLDLQNYTVRSITVPVGRMFSLSLDTPIREALGVFREKVVSRLPVWQSKAANARIVGIISLDDLLFAERLRPEQPVREFLKPALYLSEEVLLEEALRRMQRTGQHLAVVLGINQRELGIVTLQDILKAIFGEIAL